MAKRDLFLDAVDAIYGAGLEAERWPTALEAIGRLFGARGTTYEIYEKRPTRLVDLHIVGLPPQAETAYLEYYARHNPRADYAFRHLGETTLCDYQLIEERDMDRTAYYARYLKSLDLRYFLSGQIVNSRSIQGIVSIQRTRRQGHVEARDVSTMRRLLPHLRRAYSMAARLKITGAAQRSLERTLDLLVDGIALLDGDGRIVHSNAAFESIAALEDGIRVRERKIEPASREARARFATALAAAVTDASTGIASASVDLAVERPSGAPAYLVSLRPLSAGLDRGRAARSAVAMVFVRDPVAAAPAAVAVFHTMFGLTDAEAHLAMALQAGISPADYARSRALSRNTVYTHLRRLKEKTRSTRLPELIHNLSAAQSSLLRPPGGT